MPDIKELPITFFHAWGYCFDLMLCEKIDSKFGKINWKSQILTKTLYNLHVYFNADYRRDNLWRLRSSFMPEGINLLC